MKNLLSLLSLFLLLIYVQPAIGQDFNWHEAKKVKNCMTQRYLGEDDGTTYILGAGEFGFRDAPTLYLLKYNTAFDEPEPLKMKAKNPMIRLEQAFISADQKIYLFYSAGSGFNEYLTADVFDKKGGYLESVDIITNKTNPDKKMSVSSTHVFMSDNKLWFVAKYGSIFKLFDKNLKKMWEKDIQNKPFDDILILNDGTTVLSMFQDDKKKASDIIKMDKKGKMTELKLKTESEVKYDSVSKHLYVVTFGGEKDEKPYLSGGKTYKGLRISKSFSYDIYGISDMKKISGVQDIAFDKKIQEESTESTKYQGMAGLIFQNVAEPTDGSGPLFVFKTQYHFDTNNDKGPGGYDEVENIVCIKMDADKAAKQKLICIRTENGGTASGMNEMNSLFAGDKLYVFFNSYLKGEKESLTYISLNQDLKQINDTNLKTVADHDIDLDIKNMNRQDDGSYLVLGTISKKIGSASISFK